MFGNYAMKHTLETQMNKIVLHTLVCATLVTAGTVYAAPPQGVRSTPGEQRQEQRAFARPTERVEARLAYIRTALKISDAQQAQWNAYADEIRKMAQQREQRFEARRAEASGQGARRPGNSIERLERAQSLHAEAVTRINQLLAVQKPLYAALSPEQKQVADVVLLPRRHGQGRPGMQGRGGYGRG